MTGIYSEIESEKITLEIQAEIKLSSILQIMVTTLNVTLSVMRSHWK